MSDPRVIKKYPNRRLYDTVESRYITLADVRRLVVEKIDFVVVDKKNNADITRSILLQVIAEQEHLARADLDAGLHGQRHPLLRKQCAGRGERPSGTNPEAVPEPASSPRDRTKTYSGTDAPAHRPRPAEEGFKALAPVRLRDSEKDRDDSNLLK